MLKVFSLFFICLTIFVPQIAKADISYLDCYAQNNCGMCDALEVATKIAKFILGISGSLALLLFVIAGLTLIVSQGSPGKIDSAKRLMLGTLVGIAIVYLAWVGVNFIIYNFTGAAEKTGEGVARIFNKPWTEFKCVKPEELFYTKGEPTKPPVPPPPTGACGTDIGISCCNMVKLEDCCGGISTSGIKPTQCRDASVKTGTVNKLTELLTCMKKEKNNYPLLINKDLIITSISDDTGLNFCRSTTYSRPPCAHTNSSCHYGGPFKYTDGSYAADFRSTSTTNPRQNYNTNEQVAFKKLVRDCGGQFYWESDHFHVSVPSCGGL